MRLEQQIYTTADLCFLIPEISPRQLQWWDERKLITPYHEGHRRLYSPEDALAVAIVADLRKRGLPLQRIRAVIRSIHSEIGRRLLPLVARGEQPYILIDGKSIAVETNPRRVLDRLATSSRHCYLVNVAEQAAILNPESRKVLTPKPGKKPAELFVSS
jgi:DNA-binding transcriptional MerR regulator